MTHWTDKWVGLPYEGVQGCVRLYSRVARAEFGIHVDFPSDSDDWERAASCAARISEFFRRVQTPKDGDAVLLRAGKGFWHLGVAVVNVFPDLHVLHVHKGGTSRLDPLASVTLRGVRKYHFEGFWRYARR